MFTWWNSTLESIKLQKYTRGITTRVFMYTKVMTNTQNNFFDKY